MVIAFRYSVPPEWYSGVYQDIASPCSAARPFSLIHEEGAKQAVLLIHGYAGYPGELVRPARDLYGKGFDVFVPRLPGCGTAGDDFIRSRRSDWRGTVINASRDLTGRYVSVSVLGHSMGASLAVEAAAAAGIRRVVLAAPAIAYEGMKPPKPLWQMKLFSFFRKRIPTPWHHQSEYVMYYENAPADDDYLGGEYWSWVYIRQLYELYSLMNEAAVTLSSLDADILSISCGKDQIMGDKPALSAVTSGKGRRVHVHIPECSHYLFYDPDKAGEEKAVQAVIDFLAR